ncbi:cyclic GMP-AMP synthase isoform X2 [Nycticebus coucang]|uniref:cyclic GMP-AMP synthase isoform X2 n=1 Tax=Nycticebus coucang TaxID=9470 RepID=UPI00234CD88B|nr:cyclic GMP-AMP synthase isoform X2 [Nycticebus coucang]
MDSRRGKATPAAPKAGVAVPKASTRSSRGSPTEARELPAAPKAAQPRAGRCGAGRDSGARRKQGAPMEASEPPAAPKFAQPCAGRCGAGGDSGARRKQGAPMEASEPPAAPKAAQPHAGRCGAGGDSGARRKQGAPMEASEPPAAPKFAQPCAGRCGAGGDSGARRKQGAPMEASEPPAASKFAQLCAGSCGAGGESGARRKQGAPMEASEPPAASKFAQPCAGSCGAGGESGARRKQSAPESREMPPVRELGARPKKKAPRAEEPEGLGAAAAEVDSFTPPGPPLRRAASLREGSARCSRERIPQPWPAKDPSCGLALPAACACSPKATPGACKLRGVLDTLRLRAADISAAADVVNRVVRHLLDSLRRGESEFKGVALLGTGSYYEHVKISAPNEFDVMFKLEVPRIQLEEYENSGTHYFVKFKRNPKENPLNQFLEGEILSASKMLLKFRTIIKEEIQNIADVEITMERKKRGSPAVTLLIRKPKEISVDIILALESKSSWPARTQEGMPIDKWLGAKVRTKLRQQPFYLVPKHAKEGRGFQETWRLSFSHIEKEILNNHGHTKTCCEDGGVKCCRKDCLKLMKYLLEQLKKKFETRKGLDKFCSYHVKTAFFHVCTKDPDDSRWCLQNLELCFNTCVMYFLHCLREKQLQHYFIPEVNLFSQEQIDKTSIEFLSKQIEYEVNNGFPVFET